MSAALASVVFGGVFGLALAAPPGPMNAVIADETVRRGWVAGFTAGLGAMTADACFFVLALLGVVGFVGTMPRLRAVMVGIGGLLMLGFAAEAVRGTGAFTAAGPSQADGGTRAVPDSGEGAAHGPTDVDAPGPVAAIIDARNGPGAGTGRGFWKALVLALTNPYQIVFWLTVGVGLLQPGTVDVLAHVPAVGEALGGLVVVETGSPALVAGFFGGIGVWIVGFPASLVAAGRRIDRFATVVGAASAGVLGLFGVWFLVTAARTVV